MSALMPQLEYILLGAAVMLILFGFIIAVIMPGTDRWIKRYFIAFFSVLTLYGLFGIVDELIHSLPDMRPLIDIVYYAETTLSSLLIPIMTAYLLRCSGEDPKKSKLMYASAALWLIFIIIMNTGLLTDSLYDISANGQIIRGLLYRPLIIVIDLLLTLNLVKLLQVRSRLSKKDLYAMLACFVPMTIAMFIHLFVSVFSFYAFTIALSAFSMVTILLSNEIEQFMHQQREIAHQRASITVLQMRPHFIYNTMMSIYYLCKQDPDLAQQVTLDFTTYLRKNFTAIASEKLIPFSDELEHTRAYLAVEQAQFEDDLFVDYDTAYTKFLVPPLTLQPIVENAVKHGMDPDSDPLHITIRTLKIGSGSEIIVEDNGSGFDPSNNSDGTDPHIALSNIEQRLKMMCRGEITITPREGGGTVVMVTIP